MVVVLKLTRETAHATRIATASPEFSRHFRSPRIVSHRIAITGSVVLIPFCLCRWWDFVVACDELQKWQSNRIVVRAFITDSV